ncbi:MAG: hypothetical protein ACE5JD_03310 [Candidatus Methylomirabilia bacterium]
MRRLFTIVVGALLLGGLPAWGAAADWGGITPGESTTEQVRARYGPPSHESRQTLEGYDTLQWVYEEDRAPPGMKQMSVDFGLLTPKGYRPTLVRTFQLEPRPRIFSRKIVLRGWGPPDGVGADDGRQVFLYERGLVVYFDQEGEDAVSMIFTIPQPLRPSAAE